MPDWQSFALVKLAFRAIVRGDPATARLHLTEATDISRQPRHPQAAFGRKRTSEASSFDGGLGRAQLAKMRTGIGVQGCAESAFIRRQFERTVNGHRCLWELAILLTARALTFPYRVRALSRSGP